MAKVSLGQIFGVFAKMGAFTIGGGYAMLPLIEKELTSRAWVSEDDMAELIVLAQSAPGILAVNLAIYTGHKLRGLKGSVVATLGAVLPSFAAILVIAAFFSHFQDNAYVRRIFQGVRPVAVALILVPAVRMARKGCRSWWAWAIFACSFAAVALLKISPIWVIISTISVAAGISTLKGGRKR